MARRFRPPWQIVWHAESVEVQDADGLSICRIYFEDEETRRSSSGRLIAANIAKLPELLARKSAEPPISGVLRDEEVILHGEEPKNANAD